MAGAPDPEGLLAELRAVLRDADARFAGWSCAASTDCCRFRVTGREPYVTSIEALLVRKAVSAGGRRASDVTGGKARRGRGKRALDIVAEAKAREGRCPLLSDEGRCTIYASRPLGCRTFWCNRTARVEDVPHRDVVALVRRVEAIAARHELGGDEGRPLTSALSRPRRPDSG